MASINMGVIRSQAVSAIKSEFSNCTKSSINGAIQGSFSEYAKQKAKKEAREAGNLFVENFKTTVDSTPNVEAIMDLLTDIHAGEPIPTDTIVSDGHLTQYFEIPIVFGDGDRYRESLQPWKYGGVDDIISLFENGYHARASIKGIWKNHGDKPIWSLTDRAPALFGINSRVSFVSLFGDKYKMTGIEDITQNF